MRCLTGLRTGLALCLASALALGQRPLSDYAEPGVCAECHPKIAATYAATGMARSFGRMRAGAPFRSGTHTHEASGQRFTTYSREGQAYLERSVPGAPSLTIERTVDYWFGSGNHAQSYFHRAASGKLVELPVTWYARDGGYWAMSPGYDRADHAGFSRRVNYRCMFCHAGYPEVAPGADAWEGGWQLPGRLVEGIDCQRCHGPGRAHADAARSGQAPQRVRGAIVNPARLPSDRQVEICQQCHLETTTLRLPSTLLRFGRGVFSYRPGEPLADYMLHFDHAAGTGHDGKFEFVSETYRLRQSACFTKSNGRLTCTTCHNPHEILRGESAAATYSATCRSCHSAALPGHAQAKECISCHMPKRRPSDSVHVLVADHRIARRPAPESPEPVIELNDSNAPPYRGDVVLYYPASLPATAWNEMHLAVAQVKHQANLESGLSRLEALVNRHRPAHPEFYFELGEALRAAGRLEGANRYLEEACKRSPAHWRHFYALGLAKAAGGDVPSSLDPLARAAALAPREAAVWQSRGEILSRLGRTLEAAASFEKAIALDPDLAEAHNNLGTALLRLGKPVEAERALHQAAMLSPESAAIRVNFASLLARLDRFGEARLHYDQALRAKPDFAEGHSAYGTALAARGLNAEARQRYEAALRIKPDLAVTRNNLATVLAHAGDAESAIREYRLAIRYAPDYHEAHWKLGELLLSRGERAEAEAHLRKAAASPNAVVRTAAEKLLTVR